MHYRKASSADTNFNTVQDSNQNSVQDSTKNSSKETYCDNEQNSPPCDNAEGSLEAGLSELRLVDLQWVGTLGVGGFGRVELVTAGHNNNQAFALKKMKKAEVLHMCLYIYIYR